MTSNRNDARVILGVANESDDDFIWDQLKTMQADMFAAGPISIKIAYFGAEGSLPARPCMTTRWVTDPDDMTELMDNARTNCVCGCYAHIRDIFAAALEEARQAPVRTVIIIGDVFRGDPTEYAAALCAAGISVFLFQQSSGRHSDETEDTFRTLAEQTGGAYFAFNPSIERLTGRLPGLLEAVTHFAIGGRRALGTGATGCEEGLRGCFYEERRSTHWGCTGGAPRARSPFILGAARCARPSAARGCTGGCTRVARLGHLRARPGPKWARHCITSGRLFSI